MRQQMIDPYVYRVQSVVKVIDGDTIDVKIDLGFSLTILQRLRLTGIDAPSLNDKNPEIALKAKDAALFVSEWLTKKTGLIYVKTIKPEKYGRMLADLFRDGGSSLCQELLDANLAAPYYGDKREN